jgi:hypothetical protein
MASSGGLPPPCSILTAPCSSETAYSTGIGGLARAGEPVSALRVRRLDGQEVPHHPVRALRRRRRGPLRQPTPSAVRAPGDRGQDGPGRVAGCIPTRPGSCTARTAAGVAPGSTHPSRSWGTRSGPAQPRVLGERVRRVPPGDQQGGLKTAQPHRAQVAAAPAHRAEPRRARRDDQPGRPRMDAVLRRVLPLRVVHAPGAHQHLPWCAGPARSTDGYVPTGRPAQPGTASPCSPPATSPSERGSGTP